MEFLIDEGAALFFTQTYINNFVGKTLKTVNVYASHNSDPVVK